MAKEKVDYEKFAREYMKVYDLGGNMDDVAEALGISYSTASGRLDRLRKSGAEIPTLKKRTNQISPLRIARINEIMSRTTSMKKPPVV